MSALSLYLQEADATHGAGQYLAEVIERGQILYLQGQLGAGKTTLTGGILDALGHQGPVKSPTYTLVEPYENLIPPIYHFDLYRLGDPEELEYMGIRDYFGDNSVCLLEWAQRGQGFLPEADIILNLEPKVIGSEVGRLLKITAQTESGQHSIDRLQKSIPKSWLPETYVT